MKRLFILALSMISILTANGQIKSYIITRGDVLDISVMEHPEFTIEGITVLPDGTIPYPGIGSIKAAGMSLDQLKDILATTLDKFVVNPIVTVFVRKIQSELINIYGYVNKPGQYQIYEGVDILSAVAIAGGIKNFSRVRTLTIIRANRSVEKVKIREYLKYNSDAGEENIPIVYAGDTIYVKEPNETNWARLSFMSTMLLAIANIANILIN